MSLAVQACQRISDSKEYLMPCPMCSFLGHAELGRDIVHGPTTYTARNGVLMVSVCCRFSAPLFATRGSSGVDIAAKWMAMIMAALKAEEKTPGKITTTTLRLVEKGFVPCSFPIPKAIDI